MKRRSFHAPRAARGSTALGILVVVATTAVVGAGAFGLHRWSTGNAIKALVPEWQVTPASTGDDRVPAAGAGEGGSSVACEYQVADSYRGAMPPAADDACARVVEQALCSETCSNAAAGFAMHPMTRPDGTAYSYQGRLRFLGCVPSTDGTCPIHIQGVGGDHAVTDACGAAAPGCYFALSSPDEGNVAQVKDLVYACQTAAGVGSLTLADGRDRACLDAMIATSGGGLACHSWGTAFCAQNGFTDAEYYGGLCPDGARLCVHNSGDVVPCMIYACWLRGMDQLDTVWEQGAGFLGTIADLLRDWSEHVGWDQPTPPLYEPPDRARCKGTEDDGRPRGDWSVVRDAQARHSFWEYLRHRAEHGDGYHDGLNGTDRVEPTACVGP